jgi:uncharacterized protein (TIGR02246 family)
MTPEQVVQKQLDGYNACDVDVFAAMYADDAKVVDGDGKARCDGLAQLREVYGAMFKANPHQMCVVVKRITAGEYVIDDEEIIGRADNKRRHAVAIYRVRGDKIVHVMIIAK